MRLKTKLSLTFALVVLLTVALTSILSNLVINSEFKKYITKQQEQKTQELVSSIIAQYNGAAISWDVNFIHAIGMNALYDGYIVRVLDAQNQVLWDAEKCDMTTCMQVMNDVAERMKTKYPRIGGEFTSREFLLVQDSVTIGKAIISYYGPYFLSENDFHFLDTLNKVLFVIGISALILSVAVGLFMSKRISDPICKAVGVARRMAGGDYTARISSQDDTKELADLTDSVNLLAQSLRRQESLRKQLTADVAHELRTPITSAQTHLEAMIDGLWEPSTERLESCHEELTRIGSLVKDLENLAKVDNDKLALDKKPLDLSSVLHKVISSFEMDIQNKALAVTFTGAAPAAPADEGRICQAVANLLSNAIKYTPQGGQINITLSHTEKYAMLTVEDDGIGIPEHELPFIFERFYRADKSRNRKTGGSGVGLAIVKAIVEAHEGNVEAESKLGCGSCFRVMLPL